MKKSKIIHDILLIKNASEIKNKFENKSYEFILIIFFYNLNVAINHLISKINIL